MKGGNKMNFGHGFGTAMFAMKDLQDMYGQFDPKTQQMTKAPQKKIVTQNIPKPKVIQVKNTTKIPVKESQKPKLILKPTTNTAPKPLVNNTQKATQPNNSVKKVPLINQNHHQAKQPSKIIKTQQKLHQLNILQVGKNIFQLSTNLKPTKWKYFELKNDPNNKLASLIVANPQISFSFNQRNIKQGSIGNCYFICSLAALAENIEHLKQRIIPDYQKYTQKSQYFTVNMFESGKLVELKVSNSFNQCYSKPINNDITTLILQKAYAQLYGGYEIMTLGLSIDAFRDLSGDVAEYIDLKNKQKMKNQVINAFQSNNPMVIATKEWPNSQFISGKHSYNVLSYSQTNNQFYIELRDPRGWTKANFNQPANLQSKIQNGQFWVPYKDLVQNFEVITVSRFMKNSFYYYKTFGYKDLTQTGLGSLKFEVNQKTNVSASIHQKHKKFFDQKYKYNVVNIMICEVDDKMNIIRTIKTNFNSNQVCSFSLTLQKGTYVVVGQIHPFKNSNKQYKFVDEIFTISLNTDNQVKDFHILPEFNLAKALILYIRQNPGQFKQSITKQNLHRYHGSLYGKVCIFYDNQSDKNVIQQLQFDVQNVEVKEKKVMLGKGETKLIICPIGPLNNCSHKCSFKSKTFYSK